MVVQVVHSVIDNFGYYNNLGYLRSALGRGEVFLDAVNVHAPPAFEFDNKTRIYDFTRSAKKQIRENMTAYLNQLNVLPALQAEDREMIKEPFEYLFSNLPRYKESLAQVHQRQAESMHMLIFNDANGNEEEQYVAHVSFTCNSRRAAQQQFTVDASLTCLRFTYFPLQEEDFDAVLQALQNLHVQGQQEADQQDPDQQDPDQQDPDQQDPDQHAEWASSPENPDDESYSKDGLTGN